MLGKGLEMSVALVSVGRYTPHEVRMDYHCKANFDNATLIREELGVLDFI